MCHRNGTWVACIRGDCETCCRSQVDGRPHSPHDGGAGRVVDASGGPEVGEHAPEGITHAKTWPRGVPSNRSEDKTCPVDCGETVVDAGVEARASGSAAHVRVARYSQVLAHSLGRYR